MKTKKFVISGLIIGLLLGFFGWTIYDPFGPGPTNEDWSINQCVDSLGTAVVPASAEDPCQDEDGRLPKIGTECRGAWGWGICQAIAS